MSSLDDAGFGASKALLGAALGGLLCFASVTCVLGTEASSTQGGDTGSGVTGSGTGGSKVSSGASNQTTTTATATTTAATTGGTGGAASGTGGASSTSSAGGASSTSSAGGTSSTSSAGGGLVDPDTPVPDTECDGGVSPDPQVTSTTTEVLTQQQFMDLCSQANGIFEIQPNCGGSNACRGFSYEADTQTLTEHTCRATNACHGYSCVVCS